jgi:hypothetical protein
MTPQFARFLIAVVLLFIDYFWFFVITPSLWSAGGYGLSIISCSMLLLVNAAVFLIPIPNDSNRF